MKGITTNKIGILAVLGLALAPVAARADTIAQWDFNGASSTTVPGGNLAPTPIVGSGTASLFGGNTSAFNSGISNGGSSDPVTTSPPNYGWQTTTYPAQSTNEGTTGVQFLVSTAGYQDITVRFDTRHSNTSSRWVRFDFTTDGGSTWTPGSALASTIYEGTSGDTWFNIRTADLSANSSADNNSQFGIRMVSVFGPAVGPFIDGSGYTTYAPSNSASAYASTGTLRWDMVTISGTVANQNPTLTNFVVEQGLFFGGTLVSLNSSDDDRIVVLCDEIDSLGRLQVTANSPNLTPATIAGTFETKASRNDLSQFTRVLNTSTSNYDQVDFRTTTLADISYNTSIAGTNHVSGSGDIVLHIQWIPQADIDAGDGWTMSVDQVSLQLQ